MRLCARQALRHWIGQENDWKETNLTTSTSTSRAGNSGTIHTNNSESANYSALCRTGAYRKAIAMRTFPWLKFAIACLAACLRPCHRHFVSCIKSITAEPTEVCLGAHTTSLWRMGAFSSRLAALALAAAMLLVFPAPAHAQSVLVSNTGQSNAGQTSVNPNDHAQGFTTGQNTRGYSLTSIELGVGAAPGSGTLTVTVRGDDGSDDPGGNTLYTLNNPANVAAGLRTFTAPAGASLSANTQYFVQMVFAPNGSASYPKWDNTTSTLQDSGSAIGWSIRNERHLRTPGSTGWGSTNFTVLQIRVNGQIRAPAAPMNLSAAPDDGQVTLSWANPANNTITKYQYRRKTDTGTYGSWTDIPNSGDTTTSYTVTGLTNGTQYTFRVRAVNAGGNGAASTVTATPAPVPAAPTNLKAEVRDRRIGLTWDDPGDSTITKYQYRLKTGTDPYSTWTGIPNSGDTTTSYTVTGLTNGTQYTFAVRAVNNTDDGVESTVTATPLWPAPTGLVATAGQGRVTVEWNNGHDDIDDYYIYVYEDGVRRNTIFLPPGSGSTTTRTVYPLTNGTLYTFSVRALHGKESPTVTARPVSMPAPDNLTATEGDDRQTTLSWSDPGDDSIYKYQVSIDNGTTFNDISDSSKSTTTTTVTGLTNGTGYTLAVRGVNWWGYGAASTATATPLWPAPANLVATPDDGRIYLEWDTNPGITDYRVETKVTSTDVFVASSPFSAGSGSKTIAAIDSLINGTEYTFTVLATQGTADSSWPAAVNATPMAVLPDAPTNLSATPSNGKVRLSWDDPGNNTITKYQVSRDGGTSFTNISDSGASTTTTTVTGLTNGTQYTFAVRAVNTTGDGAAATTTATPVNDAPTASAKTVSIDEDTAYIFKEDDFGFASVKSGATLGHVKITALPGPNQGTLSVGGTAITGVTTPRQVTKTGLDAGNLTYTPPANANGAAFATFAFKVNDGVADSDMAYTITINVNAVNDPITGSDKTVSTDEDTAYIFKEADFAFSDVDAGAELNHVKITALPGTNQGTLSVGDTPIASVSPPFQVTKTELGSLRYTPPTNAFGAAFATFNFKVSDGTDDSVETYTITIDVNAVNDPPVAETDTAETSKNIPIVIGVLDNDSDVDPGTTLRVVEVGLPGTGPSDGTAAINPNGTTVTYTPNVNFIGDDEFRYAVTDGFDTASVPVTVKVLDNSDSNVNLANLAISQGTLMPDFAATTTSYAVTVETPTGSVQVTPTTAVGNATVTVNDEPLTSGTASDDIELIKGETTTITVVVTSADGMTIRSTTIDVTRPLSNNANLSGLTISSGTPTPVFAVGTTDYTVDVGNAVDRVTVTPTTEHADATVTVNGTLVTSGSASSEIDLIEGETTTIAVVVTAEDATTMRTYTIEVLRPRAGDETRPRVEIQTEASAPVGGAFEVTIRFSEGVLGFTLTDIGVSNGTASNFNRVSSRTYTVTITPEATGEVRVEVGSNVAEDRAGNGNQAAAPLVIEADLTRPEVEITSEATAPMGGAFDVTITFSEAVTGFEQSEITVTNGSVTGFSGSGTSYTAEITPSESGEVTVEVGAGVAEDGADNGNQAAAPLVIEADLTRPEVEITSEATAPVGGAFDVTITFSEAVTGFEQSEITVTNGSVTGFSGSGTSYTAEITPFRSGDVTVVVAADAAQDEAGNGNEAAESLVIEADLTGPRVEITSDILGPVGGAFEVTITFSEPVQGFDLDDFHVTNGTASAFTSVSAQVYMATITPSESGDVTVAVAADAAQDAAGNGNEAAESFSIEADLTRPEMEITRDETGPVAGAFAVTITFSEEVTGFEVSEIEVTNGTVVDFIEVSPSEYQATIKPTVAGPPVVLVVPEDVATDEAGNGNEAAEPFEAETAVEVSYAADSYTATEGGDAVTVTVKLSQAVDGELSIPIRVSRPETTELNDFTVEALEGWDAQEGAGTLTFTPGATELNWRIAANHDGDGDDETVKLEFGELPEIAIAGEPAVATVMLEDKGLVELQVSFAQAVYEVKEGQGVDIEMTVSPAADRRVEVPLVVALQGGTRPEDYSGVPSSVVFEEGQSEGTISVELLADEVNDPGEGIVLSLGELPEAVIAGDHSSTEVHFIQYRTAEQFSQSLEVMLAVVARSMGESAQTAIESRFERYRQWSRMEQPGEAMLASNTETLERMGAGAGASSQSDPDPGRAESPRVSSERPDAATIRSSGDLGRPERGATQSWLRNFSLGSLVGSAPSGQTPSGISSAYGLGPSVGGMAQDPLWVSATEEPPLRPGSTDLSETSNQEFNMSGVSFEMALAEIEQGNSKSWAPVLWGQGDLQYFNGELTRIGMNYRGGLDAAHLGLDLYADEQMLAGLSLMRSWGNMDYTDDGVDGVLDSRMNTFHPYLYWQPNPRWSVWGIGGMGGGQVEVIEPGRKHNFDADFKMFSAGVRSALKIRDNHELGLNADAFTAQLGTDALEDIAQLRGRAHRARLMLDWLYDKVLPAGQSLSLKLEAGGRFDGGDANRGSGLETGFRLGLLDVNSGLDVALHGRALLAHESDYQDRGVGIQASWDPGEKQRGLRASLASSWGRDGGGRTTLWDNADAVTHSAGMGALWLDPQYQMESEVAYAGIKAPGLPGVLTPFSRMRWSGQGRELGLGSMWTPSARSEQPVLPATIELEGQRRESRAGPSELAIMLHVSIPFGGSRAIAPSLKHVSARRVTAAELPAEPVNAPHQDGSPLPEPATAEPMRG